MATPNERLANSLNVLRELQQSGRRVFQSGEMGRVHRERLLKNGFLQEAVRGWLISSSPSARRGYDSLVPVVLGILRALL
jgi:hypothetical protein